MQNTIPKKPISEYKRTKIVATYGPSTGSYEQVLATQAEQVQSKSNNIDNIPEIGKLIIKEGMKNNGLYVQLNAG